MSANSWYARASLYSVILLAFGALRAEPAPAQSSAVSPAAPQVVRFGTWGVDLSTRDLAVKPGDDFQRYASGKWMDANEIPAGLEAGRLSEAALSPRGGCRSARSAASRVRRAFRSFSATYR